MAQTAQPPADLLPVTPKANVLYRVIRVFAIPFLRMLFRFQVSGAENIPRRGNYIVIANHLNWLDEFALLMLLPAEPRLHFLADPEILVTRKLQWFLVRKTGGFVPVVRSRRGDPALFRHVERCLEVGGAVAIFPEANYGPAEGQLLPFKKGFAHFAIKAGVPVVPVVFSGTKDLWLRKPIRVVIGPPIAPAGHTAESLTALAEETMARLLPEYHEPAGRRLLRRRLTHLF